MAKSKETILKQLGISSESDLPLLLEVLKKYSVITDAEKNLVKMSSVHSLPTVVKNDEQNVKQRMYGIVTDEDKGAIALMNKRNVLLEQIVNKLKEQVDDIDLDADAVLEIVSGNTEEVETLSITSEIFDSDVHIPTSKAVKLYVDNQTRHVYTGSDEPIDSKYDVWIDTSEEEGILIDEPVRMMSLRPTTTQVIEDTIVTNTGDILIYNNEDSGELIFEEEQTLVCNQSEDYGELVYNTEDCGELLYE